MDKKYELVQNDFIVVKNQKLFRIRALRDFGDVKKGDLGGYIRTEKNLSHKGECWVYDNATVFGFFAKVYEHGKLYDNSCIHDNVQVYGKAEMRGNSQAYDNANLRGKSTLHDNVKVYDDVVVSGEALIYDECELHDNARITGNTFMWDSVHLTDNALVSEFAVLRGNIIVRNNAVVTGHSVINSKKGEATIIGSEMYISGKAYINSNDDICFFKGVFCCYTAITTFTSCTQNILVNVNNSSMTIDEFKSSFIRKNKRFRERFGYSLLYNVIKLHYSIIKHNDKK